MTHYHPRMDDEGQPVKLTHPSLASDSSTWSHASHIATVTPDGPLPERINHLAIESWVNAPTNANGWEQLANASNFIEPPMRSVSGKPPASGAVVVESDGRVWVVSPSNGFGGYTHTFPKGKLVLKGDLGLRANALKEVFEETGLQVELTGFLCDAIRSTSVTRFYLAMRVGGNPAAMGWESQATHLVPMEQLAGFVSHANDKIVVQSLRERPRLSRSDIVSYEWGLTSVHRILATVADFRWQYGQWPKRLLMDRGMVEVIPKDILTPLGWQMLNLKLEIVAIDDGTLFAEGAVGERCEYGDHFHLQEGPSVTFWIWGIELLER